MNKDLKECQSQGFISKVPSFWEKPSQEGILRAALAEAVRYAQAGKVPMKEVSDVWDLLVKDV